MSFTEEALSRIVEMAWEDRTPLEAIQQNLSGYGFSAYWIQLVSSSETDSSTF